MSFSRFNTRRLRTRAVRDLVRAYRSGTVERNVVIGACTRDVWERISRVMDLEPWVSGVVRTRALGRLTRGIGASRIIKFENGDLVRERIVGWRTRSYFSYIMVDGLPLRSYHATISVRNKGCEASYVSWRSYFGGKRSTRAEFGRVASAIGTLYTTSLEGLKRLIEDGTR